MSNVPPCQPPLIPPKLPPRPLLTPQRATAHSLVQGNPLGNVYPVRPDPGPSAVDARTAALRWLGRYLTENLYRRVGDAGGPDIAQAVETFYVDEPDPEVDVVMPCLVFIGEERAEQEDLWNQPDEATKDQIAPGTVLYPMWMHKELIDCQVWGSHKGMVRALAGGISQLLSPVEERVGMLILMPDYYNQVARFTLDGVTWGPDAAGGHIKNRRIAHVHVMLEVDVVRLVNYVGMLPTAVTDVEEIQFSNPNVVLSFP